MIYHIVWIYHSYVGITLRTYVRIYQRKPEYLHFLFSANHHSTQFQISFALLLDRTSIVSNKLEKEKYYRLSLSHPPSQIVTNSSILVTEVSISSSKYHSGV